MFKITNLKYEKTAFANLSQKSFDYHHGKHHATYVNNLNDLITKNPGLQDKTLEELIKLSYSKKKEPFYKKLFNNAAQHYNHDFFWNSITPEKTTLSNVLLEKMNSSFESFELFKEQFELICLSVFGSGWVWLIYNESTEELELYKTENAENPIYLEGVIPLLACDIWEHAYYIDYFNERKKFVETIFEYFDWNFADKNFQKHVKKTENTENLI
ncbi:superoxide dismutase [Alphaproteobacteria bacterium endosymbiont of Tiliacea citrago]|uniref:superoxide dismutase n=1 Tax=Alphaproteobacteria bacterium endosymbiont of Tiliacea citrago TaxID=3077944 RepID=UPI00313CA19E